MGDYKMNLIKKFVDKKAELNSCLISFIPFCIGDQMMTGTSTNCSLTLCFNGKLSGGDYFNIILCSLIFYGIPYFIYAMVKKRLKYKYALDYIEAPEDIEDLIKSLETKINIIVTIFTVVLVY
jgi:hypothetical protein